MKKLQDFKLTELDTRLVLFGSTVFKIKCRTSVELQAALREETVRERIVQRDLKRITAAVLSQVITQTTLPLVRTDNIAVYTDSSPWISCEKLYFGHYDQPLTAHPRVILMFVSLPPPPPPPPPPPASNTLLGKHCRDGVDLMDRASRVKKIREDHDIPSVPDPSEAHLPVEEGRVDPDPDLVKTVAEESKRRLYSLTQPSSSMFEEEEADEEDEEEEEDGKERNPRSFIQYIKSFFGWS